MQLIQIWSGRRSAKNSVIYGICCFVIDVKYIAIEFPSNSGSLFYNYKGFFSLVLLGACDVKYTFTLIDIGSYGGNNDCGILAQSLIGKRLDENKAISIK